MVGLSILCVIIVLVDRAVHEPGDRIPADGLDRLAAIPYRRRPCRSGRSACASTRRRRIRRGGRARITRRGLLAVVALLAVTVVAAQSCQQSQVRLSKEHAIDDGAAAGRLHAGAHAGPARAPGPQRPPVLGRLVLGPRADGRRLHEADDRARRREHGHDRGGQPGALGRLEQPEPPREPRRRRRLQQQRGDDRERDDARRAGRRSARRARRARRRAPPARRRSRASSTGTPARCASSAPAGRAACRRAP